MRILLIASAALAAGIFAIILLGQLRQEAIPTFSSDHWDGDAAVVARGEYLATAGNCASCHSVRGGGFMAGGVAFETPFGRIHSTNITPDRDTGIGQWTGEQFHLSMRRGVRAGGEHLYPVFPYTAFTKISDDDVAALFAYLKSLPAVRQETPPNDLAFPFNQRWLMIFWKALFFDDGVYRPDPAQSGEWNRGAYLVDALGHCSACHSPRNLLGAESGGHAFAGGEIVDRVRDGTRHPWSAPNLTSAESALGMWSHDELSTYLKTGQNAYVDLFGPMNEVIQNSTRHLDDADINAMTAYLKSIPAIDDHFGPVPDNRVLGMGRTVYNLHCGTCHLPTGLGDVEQAPRLARGSLVLQSGNPAALINVILYGPERPDPPLSTLRRNPMDEFQYLLTDDEVAAVASYVRNNWGNSSGQVSADQVQRQR